MGVAADGSGVSPWSDENVLKLTVLMAGHSEYTRSPHCPL